MNVVRLDRRVAWRAVLLTLLLAWPLILFGRPAYFSDSLSYYKGGKVAVAYEVGKIASLLPVATFQPVTATLVGGTPPGAPPGETNGARSILYSAAAYLLSGPDATMISLVLAQSIVTALTITIVAMALGATGLWNFILLAGTVAVATPVAWFANLTGPDIFAGLLICIVTLLATHLNRLSVGACLTLTMVGAFAVAGHASHPPLAAGLFILGLISMVVAPPTIGRRSRVIGWLLAPLALGVAATILSGFIGFGEMSIAPKRFPLALARSVEDGPARWYLEKNCATHRYAVCEVFGNDFPSDADGNLRVSDFLWGERGLRQRASAEQMDRIRAEEQEIVLRAAEAYPSEQAARTFKNISRQLVYFGLTGMNFNQRLVLDAGGNPYLESLPEAHARVLNVVETLSILLTLLCMGWMFWRFRVLPGEVRTMLLLVIAGILGNAVICAAFSGVADRYQARVIWVLPMVSIALMLGWRNAADRYLERGPELNRLGIPESAGV